MTDAEEDDVLALNKSIYDLVQAARQYHKTAVKFCVIGFNGGEVDPYLFWKRYEKGVDVVAIYMDGNLVAGNCNAIVDAVEQLKKNGFVVKVEDNLRDYLSCEIGFNSDRTIAWFGQPHLLTNLERNMGKMFIA